MVDSQTLAQVEENPTHPDIAKRSVCLSFKMGRPGGRRKVPSSLIQVVGDGVPGTDLLKQPDKELLHVSKSVLECETLKEIGAMDSEMITFIRARCLPSMLRAGIYLLPVVLLEEVDARINEFINQRALLVRYFVEN